MCRTPRPHPAFAFLRDAIALSMALIALSSARVAAADPPGVEFDDPILTLTDVLVDEGDSGTSLARFVLRLSSSPATPVVLEYTTEDRSAQAGDDYLPRTGLLTFEAGIVEQIVEVPVLGDTLLEPNESFALRIVSLSGAKCHDDVAVARVLNEERTTFAPATELYFAPYYAGTMPTAWGDYDSDGDPDMALYANDVSGGFSEIPGFRQAVQNGNYHGVAWCDFDKDGDADCVLTPYDLLTSVEEPSGIGGFGASPRMKLLRNDNGTFVDVAPLLGMDLGGNGETAVWADFDADGWPDLFVPFYAHVPPYRSFLFRNRGGGQFESVGEAAGVHMPGISSSLKPEGAHALDWNGDGSLDLYCASHLFVNDGTGRFHDVREEVGLPAVFDEGAFFVDHDNDGDWDLYLRTFEGPRLFQNDGGAYTDVTAQSGLVAGNIAWGDNQGDVDNDGDVDFVFAGHNGTPRLLLNRGDGTFVIDEHIAFFDGFINMCAFADADGDGDLDIAYDGPFGRRLLRNHLERKSGAWGSSLRLRVLDWAGHETAFGATIRVRGPYADSDGVQMRAVDGGSAYLTQNDYLVHFGGVGPGPLSIEVHYAAPPGATNIIDGGVAPELGGFEKGPSFAPAWRIYQDGRVEPDQFEVTAAGPGGAVASRSRIARVLPPPARASASFELALEQAGEASIVIHDVRGRRVRRLDASGAAAGTSRVAWNLEDESGRAVTAGVYLCQLVIDGRVLDVRRVPVVR